MPHPGCHREPRFLVCHQVRGTQAFTSHPALLFPLMLEGLSFSETRVAGSGVTELRSGGVCSYFKGRFGSGL